MTTFNLQKHIDKIASDLPNMTKLAERSYEGVQGYFVAQTRSWQNCSRKKMLKGSTAQEAWESCLKEYQDVDDNIDWVAKNALEDSLELQKNAQTCGGGMLQMGSYLEKIKKHRSEGKTIGQAVMAALQDCESEAGKIHESATKKHVKTAKYRPKICPSCRVECDEFDTCPVCREVANDAKPGYRHHVPEPDALKFMQQPMGQQLENSPLHASSKPKVKIACGGCGCGQHGNKKACGCPSGCDCKKSGGTCCKSK